MKKRGRDKFQNWFPQAQAADQKNTNSKDLIYPLYKLARRLARFVKATKPASIVPPIITNFVQ